LIRQIRRLTRQVPAFGNGTIAIAVYSHPNETGMNEQAAAEQGFEGVACVDDAARAALVYIRLWQRHGLPWARDAALGLLTFVRAMQTDDGTFVNFIFDWDGRQNLTSTTSRPGDGPWVARAMHALAAGAAAFDNISCKESFDRGLPWLRRPTPYLDLRAVSVLAAVEYWRTTGSDEVSACALAWADEIADAARDGLLPDQVGQSRIHLWGHLQETALAEAGTALQRPDLIEAARRSTEAALVPPVEQQFPGPRILPFDVSCVVSGLDAVAAATGESRYERLAGRARAWFDGQNTAGAAIYDRAAGLVFDGIDGGRVSQNSGAESNIEGALALLDSLPLQLYEEFPPSPPAGHPDAETGGPRWDQPPQGAPSSSREAKANVSGR
jgi:hypothetical protein